MRLKPRWNRPVFSASLLPLMVASKVSLHVPNSAPNIMAIAPPSPSIPFFARIIAIPTVADDDRITKVVIAPVSAPDKGFSALAISFSKVGLLRNGSTARSIVNNPKNNTPKYKMILAMFPSLPDFEMNNKMNPIKRSNGEYFPMSNASIWLLTVVPIFAPSTIPIACRNFKTFEFTNTIVIIITAEDESSSVVTTTPVRIL